jgi:predicted amidohydrolase
MKVNVSCIQMDIVLGDVAANLKHGLEMIDKSVVNNPDIICLPELFTTGFCLSDAVKLTEDSLVKNTIKVLSDKAYKLNCWLIAGSILEREDSKIYNTSIIFTPKGSIAGKYRKIHLFKPFKEHKYLTPGNTPVVIDTDCGRISVVICYDLRFPELFQKLKNMGVKVIFVVAEFPYPRLHHWQILLKARAIENFIFTIGVNRIGYDDQIRFFGHTMAVAPSGEVIKALTDKEGILNVSLDLEDIARTEKILQINE